MTELGELGTWVSSTGRWYKMVILTETEMWECPLAVR